MTISKSFLFLQQEGCLFNSCITQGLTALRSATISRKGDFYVAFFHLSIGLERLMKVLIIMDHMEKHDLAPPSYKILKKFSHKIDDLWTELKKIEVDAPKHPLADLLETSIEYEILVFLSDFAESARFFNLNSLGNKSGDIDPLEKWDGIILRLLEEDVSKQRIQRIAQITFATTSALNGGTVVVGHDLRKSPLGLQDAIAQPMLQDAAASFAILRLFKIIRPLRELLWDVNHRAMEANRRIHPSEQVIPYMYEFLDFALLDRRSILRKVKWP